MDVSSSISSRKRPRMQCRSCNQTLSYSAYCRHQQTKSCISVSGHSMNDQSSSDNDLSDIDSFSESFPSTTGYDNMLDDSNVRGGTTRDGDGSLMPLSIQHEPDVTHCNNSSSDESDDLAPEIWDEDSEPDSEQEDIFPSQQGRMIHYVLSYFLLFFQLCYHISDRGLQHILTLISSIFYWLSKVVTGAGKEVLIQLSTSFPKTLYSLKKTFGAKSNLVYYCVCPTCHTLYKEVDCVITSSRNTRVSRKCDHVEFPRHPQRMHRMECGTELMKCIKVGKKSKLVPRKRYVYNSIANSVRQFASRPGFFESCEMWRKQDGISDCNFMTDVYDGKLWKDWKPFLDIPGNLLLMLNVDWFKPFKHSPYSVGVIYLVILNLPRMMRFKPENIIVVGTIPGPREPKLTINTYLQPMVDELITLWEGIDIETSRSVFGARRVRVALCCISSDIPATRKLCGFYGFKAKRGCSKCMKEFVTTSFSESTDYSGFEREQWPPRNLKVHHQKAIEARNARSNAARTEIEREVGVRYSELLRLPYLDIIRCHLIDPMHNLFLGTAKNILTLWKTSKIMSEGTFSSIQDVVDSISVPPRIGRLPEKIASGFSGFTAEQWMAWTIIYSPFILKGVLPPEHYEMWCLFSQSCSLFCRSFIHHSELVKADELMMSFCKKFEVVFGKQEVTPNMHMHAHLRDCVLDVGPVYSFWCFSFERYNGILEHLQKTWHSPEIQIMEKFTLMQTLNATDVSTSSPPELVACLNGLKKNYVMLEDTVRIFDSKSLLRYEKNLFCLPASVCATKQPYHCLLPPLREKFLPEHLRDMLKSMYVKLYSPELVQHVPMRYEQITQLDIFGQIYISLKSRSSKSRAIMAIWPGLNGAILDRECNTEDVRIGIIEYLISHTPKITGIPDQPHILAKVKWFQDHPRKNWFSNSVILSATLFDADSEASFIPVSRIMSRCAFVKQSILFDYGSDNVNVCMPLIRRITN